MRTSTKASLLFALFLPILGGCGSSDSGTTGVNYDPAAVQKTTDTSAMPPQARAAMEHAMGGAGAKTK